MKSKGCVIAESKDTAQQLKEMSIYMYILGVFNPGGWAANILWLNSTVMKWIPFCITFSYPVILTGFFVYINIEQKHRGMLISSKVVNIWIIPVVGQIIAGRVISIFGGSSQITEKYLEIYKFSNIILFTVCLLCLNFFLRKKSLLFIANIFIIGYLFCLTINKPIFIFASGMEICVVDFYYIAIIGIGYIVMGVCAWKKAKTAY